MDRFAPLDVRTLMQELTVASMPQRDQALASWGCSQANDAAWTAGAAMVFWRCIWSLWYVGLTPRKHTIAVPGRNHVPHLRDWDPRQAPPFRGCRPMKLGEDWCSINSRLMIQLPNLELKPERDELVKLMSAHFKRTPGYLKTKAEFTQFVNRMGNRNVLDCLAVIRQ